jgi:hypothetical protein
MNRQKRVQLDRARKDRQARAHIQRLMSRAGIKRVAAATARLHGQVVERVEAGPDSTEAAAPGRATASSTPTDSGGLRGHNQRTV